MIRLHLFEFEDQPWLPSVFRDFITDHLHHISQTFKPFRLNLIAPKIRKAMEESGDARIIDLCSGAGGPVLDLQRRFEEEGFRVSIVLTDLYPNLRAFEQLRKDSNGKITYVTDPVNATDPPDHLKGFQTLFAGLHHFRPQQARAILSRAVKTRTGIGIFEGTERSLVGMVKVFLVIVVLSITNTHRIGKLTVARFLLTYLLPIAPLLFAWDGCVSCLRTYSINELRALVRGIDDADYSWEIGKVVESVPKIGKVEVIYMIGTPHRALEIASPSMSAQGAAE